MKKVIKIFVISFIILISCNAVSQNEKIDATTKQYLLDRYKKAGVELYESIDEMGYNAFSGKILKMSEEELKKLGELLKD